MLSKSTINRLRAEDGLSFIEFVVSVVVVSVLVLIALHLYSGLNQGVAELIHDSNLKIIDQGVRVYKTLYNEKPKTIADLVRVEILEQLPDIPQTFGFTVEGNATEYYLNEEFHARPLRTSGEKPVYGLGVD